MSALHTLLAPLIDLLDDVREGAPRHLTLRAAEAVDVRALVRAAAGAAVARGFVAVSLDDYIRRRDRPSPCGERSCLLIAEPGCPAAVQRQALMDAAARSSRPHVLLTLEVSRPSRPMVREARASYGPSIAMPEDVVRQVRRAERSSALIGAGSHAAAERLLRDVLGALTRRRAWLAASSVGGALGRLLLERGRAGDADPIFADAARHAEAGGEEAEAALARLWQAAARVDAGLLVAAEAQCRAVLAAGVPGADVRALASATLARVLTWQDRIEQASETMAGITSTAGNDPYVLSVAVRVALARGDHFEAGLCLSALTAAASASGQPTARLIASLADLRAATAAGDLAGAAARLHGIRDLAREARAPLRLVRARLLWTGALRRAGRAADAARELRWLERMRGVCPPLLRSAIDAGLRGEIPSRARIVTVAPVASELLAMARDEEDDRQAVATLLNAAAGPLRCSRIDVVSADAGPASSLVSCGNGQASTLGRRVLDAGVSIGPESQAHAIELAVPVRLGTTVLAALAARWPADRAPSPHARDLMDTLAAIAAPRVDSMLAAAREEARASILVPELVGGSAAMTELRKAIARAAGAPFAVLIQGESGVGKELAARAIHQLGPRRERRFCDVNCAALSDDLLESELFGHARGAFTGAVAERAGLFEEANGGTLFMDEVADLSPRAQAKLLRAIQQQEVRRVGETFNRPVDVRIVAAANRDLRVEADGGRFRQDLLYRLDVIRLLIPPLRERPDDVAQLAVHFWRAAAARVGTAAELSHGVVAALAGYHWPGNVRELLNVIAALAVAAPARGAVRPHLLPAAIAGATQIRSARLADARQAFERRFVEAALARAGGSRTRAARELGISRQGLLKILLRVGAA